MTCCYYKHLTFLDTFLELPTLLQQHLSTLPPGNNTQGPDIQGFAFREEARKENERAEKRKRANESKAQAVKRAHSSQRVCVCVVCGLEKNKDHTALLEAERAGEVQGLCRDFPHRAM